MPRQKGNPRPSAGKASLSVGNQGSSVGKASHGFRSDATVRVARLFKLLGLIRTQGTKHVHTIEEFTQLLDCARATVFREIKLLEDEGLVGRDGKGGYFLLERGQVFPTPPLSAADALALAVAQTVLVRPDTPLSQEISSALEKASSGFSPKLRTLLRQAARQLQSTPTGPSLQEKHSALSALFQGMLQNQTVSMDYESHRSGRSWRELDPYHISQEQSGWMVHGWCHKNRQILSFALDRLVAAELTEGAFQRDEEAWARFWEPEGVFAGLRGGELVEVRVCFAPKVAEYALRSNRWPKGLEAKLQEDGSVLLMGAARGTGGILVQLLRWRRYAQVEGGAELRAAMIAELAAMAGLYAGNASEQKINGDSQGQSHIDETREDVT